MSLKIIHISKTGCEKELNIKKKHSKSCKLRTNLEKTLVLTISTKYLHIYEINHPIAKSSTKNMKTNHVKSQILPILTKVIAYLCNKSYI